MRESRGTAESELEGLFKEETPEDHEVVPVAVLWLHYLGGVKDGLRHVDYVFGFSSREIGVFTYVLVNAGRITIVVYTDRGIRVA